MINGADAFSNTKMCECCHHPFVSINNYVFCDFCIQKYIEPNFDEYRSIVTNFIQEHPGIDERSFIDANVIKMPEEYNNKINYKYFVKQILQKCGFNTQLYRNNNYNTPKVSSALLRDLEELKRNENFGRKK